VKRSFLNKVYSRLAIACLAGLAASGCATTPLPAASNQNYDFAYQTSGGTGVRPSQVFDDGTKTYFQFPIGKFAPVIELDEGGRRKLLEPMQEGLYYTVPLIGNRFVLQRGQETAVKTALFLPSLCVRTKRLFLRRLLTLTPCTRYCREAARFT
jgi:type IV secretory pathway VirB9-like protein